MANNETNIYNIIGKNIRKYRRLKGWTQHELSERLVMSDSFIAKLESITYQTLSIDTLEQIARVLGRDIRDFFDPSVVDEN